MSKLRGPIAYLNRVTTDGRKLAALTVRELPIPLLRRNDYEGLQFDGTPMVDETERVGELTNITIKDDVVWADATMKTNDPVGTRYPVGIDLGVATVVYVDNEGNELGDVEAFLSDDITALFTEATLMAATIEDPPSATAWPDAYLEVVES